MNKTIETLEKRHLDNAIALSKGEDISKSLHQQNLLIINLFKAQTLEMKRLTEKVNSLMEEKVTV